jgi:hypothetical protein
MSNSKIVLLAFIIAAIATIIAEFIASIIGSPLLFAISFCIVTIASIGAIIKQKQWRFLAVCAIACILILMSSCKSIVTSTTSAKTFAVEHGDPRWDDCKDIYQQWYSVTVCNDTLATYRVYYHDCFERQGSCLEPHLVRTSKNQVRHD